MPFNTFPTLSPSATIKYPEDTWSDPDIMTIFDDQQSVEVINSGSGGFWVDLTVIIQAPEAEADTIFAFLVGQRLRGIPFNFAHRKRGTILVRYFDNKLPYKRVVSGNPDFVEFTLPLRAL